QRILPQPAGPRPAGSGLSHGRGHGGMRGGHRDPLVSGARLRRLGAPASRDRRKQRLPGRRALSKEGRMILRVLMASLTLAACAATTPSPPPGPPTPPLAGSSWIASTMDDQPLAPGEPPTIAFGTDQRVSGDTGCNRYMGPFIQEGSSLR